MEIRSILPEEAEEFLALLCSIFGLDPNRARQVFYSEPYFDLQRKWALFVEGSIVSILTTTPMRFGWGKAFGIAGVGTRAEHRGKGYGARLLGHVCEVAQDQGEPVACLFAHRPELYHRVGFRVLDEVVRGDLRVSPIWGPAKALESAVVEEIYNAWAEQHEDRLRRDDQRWRCWRWSLKVCEPFGQGYVCLEASVVREALLDQQHETWPVPAGTKWFGLRSMTEMLGVPLRSVQSELLLMARGLDHPPQMFMTDQF